MKVLNLRCQAAQHPFEGWFGSEDDFQDQLARGLLTCPLCGDHQIEKMPSAPRINRGVGRAADVPRPEAQDPATARQAQLMRQLREAAARAEDVGERFADEARRMHAGDIESRQIKGRASMAQTLELLEEGVPVMPLPANVTETLQ
jgi:hypothetical protein